MVISIDSTDIYIYSNYMIMSMSPVLYCNSCQHQLFYVCRRSVLHNKLTSSRSVILISKYKIKAQSLINWHWLRLPGLGNHCRQKAPVENVLSASGTSHLGLIDIHTVVYPIRNGHFKMADCKSSKR